MVHLPPPEVRLTYSGFALAAGLLAEVSRGNASLWTVVRLPRVEMWKD